MATPEETRERIKEMRERIFERSTEVSVKNDSQETPQKSDPNKNETKNLQSSNVQSNEVEPLSSLDDVPTEIIQQKNNKASLLFYDKEEKIQLRVKAICEINNQNSITEESWKKTQHISRRCYLTDSAPGTISNNPTSGMISQLENFDYTMEQSEDGYKNFTVIKCKIKSVEWLYLAAKGHRRAKFDFENNKEMWLVP